MRLKFVVSALLVCTALSACGPKEYSAEDNRRLYKVGKPYRAGDNWYTPKEDYAYDETGLASWYGPGFHRNDTANGEKFDKYAMTAAHKTLPMPSMVKVTNLENGRSVKLRVNDRGPFVKGRIIDVSKKAAEQLGFRGQGTAKVRVQYLAQETAALFGGNVPGQKGLPKSFESYEVSPPTQLAQRDEPEEQQYVRPAPVASYTPRIVAEAHADEMPVRAATSDHVVRVGLFRLQKNAHMVQKDVSRFGIAKLHEVVNDRGQFYSVQVGPFRNDREAEQALNTILQSGYPDAFLLEN